MFVRLISHRPLAALLLTATFAAGCMSVGIAHRSHNPDSPPQSVDVPVRAHLHSGRTVLYRQGFTLVADTVIGFGVLYGLRLDSVGIVARLPLDSVAAMESVHRTTNVGASLLLTAGALAATAALGVAAFGSCPTFYAVEGENFVLEAEGFSYSISPLLEGRDVDLLGLRVGDDGNVTLEVRNEALETHYINHLEILEVRHGDAEVVVPDYRGQPLVLSGLRSFDRAVDRSGRDVLPLLAGSDEHAYATPYAVLEAATEQDLGDWIELTAALPRADTVALSLRLRNSLLTTILLYDYILAAQGARALTWLGRDIEVIENAIELANWYTTRMGMRVSIRETGTWREVARVPATGPIAWETVAISVPVPRDDSLRVRLSFAADEWRVDEVALGTGVRSVAPRVLPLSSVVDAHGADRPDIVWQLSEPDDLYLETRPGSRFTASFRAGPEPTGERRTFLLNSQGYYVEWIRSGWMRSARVRSHRFLPSDRVLLEAIRSWNAARDTFEHAFYSSRIPVR